MNSKSFLAITGLVVILLGTGTYMAMGRSSTQVATVADATQTQTQAQTVPTPTSAPLAAVTTPPPVTTTVAAPVTSAYKDGTYTSTASYNVPEGKTESLTVTITLKNDVITDSTVVSNAKDHDSKRYSAQFISGYKSMVTGKKITDVDLSLVSGSSLTSSGWNNAIRSIESEAKV